MIRKTGKRLKRLANGTSILRHQALKRSSLLKKYREEPIRSTLLKSGESIKGLIFKASDLRRDHKLLIPHSNRASRSWFFRFLQIARDRLYNPDSELMRNFRVRLDYNLTLRTLEELT